MIVPNDEHCIKYFEQGTNIYNICHASLIGSGYVRGPWFEGKHDQVLRTKIAGILIYSIISVLYFQQDGFCMILSPYQASC